MKYLIQLTALFSLSMVLNLSTADDAAATDSASDSPDLEMQAGNESVDESTPAGQKGILHEPLDGSSIESFTAGLKKVDEEASEKDYRYLMSSLDYLLFYDIGANRDKATLYSRLDGKTPAEIVEEVANSRKK